MKKERIPTMKVKRRIIVKNGKIFGVSQKLDKLIKEISKKL
ncbi:MAG: hypothetical protein AB1410_01865 [Acidobacteriota bacterium]